MAVVDRNLTGKIVVVTGAARGLGRELASAALDGGAKLVAVDRDWSPSGFSGDKDQAFLDRLRSAEDQALVLSTDIGKQSDIEAAYAQTLDKFGTVDVLINNAALRQRDVFPPLGRAVALEVEDAQLRRFFDVNVFGTYALTKQFIKPMLEKQSGSIMSVASSGALHDSRGGAYEARRPGSGEMPYQSTKAALITMMFYLAAEVRSSNVAVNTLIPGHTRTTGFDEQNAARRRRGGGSNAPQVYRADHMVDIAMMLCGADASTGLTGKAFDVPVWNAEHGLGTLEDWTDEEAERGIQAAMEAQ